MSLEQTYRSRFPRSAELYEQARQTFPGGVTHDVRYHTPFPLYIERSQGAYKWTVDGKKMIDFVCGHGALLLGHAHQAVVTAVQQQVEQGTHFGAGHPLELRWGGMVRQLVPGADMVRFTSSGTEATLLALRLARAFSRKPAVLRFEGHFHGWHDMIAPGADPGDPHAGIMPDLLMNIVVAPTDIDAVQTMLAGRDDIGAVIVEAAGAAYGTVPLADSFLRDLRALTKERDLLLIVDEVVTGFRISPGGLQQRAGVTADLTTLAKILAGGLPGGAVAGRADVLRHLDFGDEQWNSQHKVRHQGTYNANPLAAAAGSAALAVIAEGDATAIAAERGRQLMNGINDVLIEHRMRGWCAYGDGSLVHILAGASVDSPPGEFPAGLSIAELKRGGHPQRSHDLRLALLCSGIDMMRGRSAFVSAAHSSADIDQAVAAFDQALALL